MPVDVTDEFIWIAIQGADSFVQSSFRQVTLSAEQGIHARIGKLKSDPDGSTTVQAYYFSKSQWSVGDAEKWVKEHKKSNDSGLKFWYPSESELRLNYDKSGPRIAGYAAVFNQRTSLWPGLDEQVAPGAFTDSIRNDDVRALFNHNPEIILGRTKAGTLRLWEDEKGLGYEIIVDPDDDDAKKVIRKIKRGDISQSSFGFEIVKRSMEEKNGVMLRTIRTAKLYDVSPVTFPAYPQTEGLSVRMTRFVGLCLVEDEVIELGSDEESAPSGPSLDELAEQTASLLRKVRGS